jgi:hypothetical protein
MDYTREPIIETIITPRDGSKLTIRNSKVKDAPDYTVDAVEVVSFGNSFFYRSMERPKSFLVPVSDYEVVESKETRVVLKNATIDKSIKIAGGRVRKEPKEEPRKTRARRSTSKSRKPEEKTAEPKKAEAKKAESKKAEPKKAESKKAETKKAEPKKTRSRSQAARKEQSAENKEGGTRVSSSMFRSLFPPPSSLISENIAKEEQASQTAGQKTADDPVKEESKT